MIKIRMKRKIINKLGINYRAFNRDKIENPNISMKRFLI